ncbi:MAG: hypothetical protein PHF29_04325 [Candidatus Riflebacteria bacterium]|nr:hypothetical protein [Candidatus Riflebacteria bacterium]
MGDSMFSLPVRSVDCTSGILLAKEKSKPKKSKKSSSKTDKAKSSAQSNESTKSENDSDYLPEPDSAKSYVPDIYRCPECGYEQDVIGTCPDHATIDLVFIRDKARDPLAPAEYDGNEDIIVDIPLKNVVFKKEILEDDKTEESDDSKTDTKK